MDNANYHSTIMGNFPNTGPGKKKSLKNGCTRILLNVALQKPHLNYAFVSHHSQEKVHELNRIANELVHLVIRLLC